MLIEPFRSLFKARCFVKTSRYRPTVAASQCLLVLPALVLLLRDLGLIPLAANVFACERLSVRNIITRSIQEIDWTDGVYGVLPTAKPLDVLKAIDKMLVMGAAMDPAALKAGVLAHSEAIKSIDGKGVTTLADYTATNAAIGHMIASVPASKTMDVYNAFNKFSLGKDVGPYMMSKVNAEDAKAAYKAFLEFKDVVKASQR